MGLYFYKKSCLYKNAIGCNFAGGMLLYGLGQKEDDFESIKYFEKSCSLGFKPACENYKNLVD
jgi:TPR repeat protein